MSTQKNFSSYNLDHLGLVAGMIDELGIAELTDKIIVQDKTQRHVSVGTCIKAMVLNGLGFINRALYLMPQFFADKPVERLLGKGVLAEHLNDDTLGRALDKIYEYGAENLYAQLAAQSVGRLGLSCSTVHLDSTSFHVDGQYNSHQDDVPENVIHITKGYSRDHRPDLNQVVLQLISEQQAGIPLLMAALSGNSNDKKDFRKTIANYIKQLKEGFGVSLIVADSALYTAETLLIFGYLNWLSRVPETISGVKEVILAVSGEWIKTRPEEGAFAELGSNYGDIKQRWLVVYTRAAHERAEQSIGRQALKSGELEYKEFNKLISQSFACIADAESAIAQFEKKLKTLQLHNSRIVQIPVKQPLRKVKKITETRYRIEAGIASDLETHYRKIQQKSCFILATNQLDHEKLSNIEMLSNYNPGQQKVERGFRFLKDPFFMADTLFIKSKERIKALMVIMTLSLLVYSALEYRIREKLKYSQHGFPSQVGKPVKKPTARWVFQYFRGIHLIFDKEKNESVLNCNIHQKRLIELLGNCYIGLYSDSA